MLNYLRAPLGLDDTTVNTWYAHWIARGFEALEERSRRLSGDGRHLYGSTVTLADVCLVPQVANAKRFKVPLDAFPKIIAAEEACQQLPAFDKARPENQPDAE